MEKSNKTKFRFGLMAKFVLMILVSVLTCTSTSISASMMATRSSLEGVTSSGLQVLTYSVRDTIENICRRPLQADEETFNLYKGSVSIADELENFLQQVKLNTDYDVTVFYGDTRYLTTIESSKGETIGTKCSAAVKDAVLNRGEEYYSPHVDINNVSYGGYYIPLRDPDGSIAGMVFAGIPNTVTASVQAGIRKSILMAAIIAGVLGVGATVIVLFRIINVLNQLLDALHHVTHGDVAFNVNKMAMLRSDELGDLARAVEQARRCFVWILGSLAWQSSSLTESSNEISTGTINIVNHMGQLETAMNEIASGATAMASELVDAADQTEKMGQCVDVMRAGNRSLHEDARIMRDHSNESKQLLKDLMSINTDVETAIDAIYTQTLETDKSVEAINSAINIINDIAEETNLLSLNASIEAARAGEAGRGFAVVASQIQKLADQSNQSASDIIQVVNKLKSESRESVDTMNSVRDIVVKQSGTVDKVKLKFDKLLEIIDDLVGSIGSLSKSVDEVEDVKIGVISVTQDLTAIAEENAASTEETSASVAEVNVTLGSIRAKVEELDRIAANLSVFLGSFTFDKDEATKMYAAQVKHEE